MTARGGAALGSKVQASGLLPFLLGASPRAAFRESAKKTV